MQTDHYMANMVRSGRTERFGLVGLERADDLAGAERRQVVAAPDLAPGRSAEKSMGVRHAHSELCPALSRDDAAQPA
jgi:hypothetical protein